MVSLICIPIGEDLEEDGGGQENQWIPLWQQRICQSEEEADGEGYLIDSILVVVRARQLPPLFLRETHEQNVGGSWSNPRHRGQQVPYDCLLRGLTQIPRFA